MKPKNKAEELIDKIMASTENAKLSDYSQIYSPTAKKIALLMVDEIINSVVITDLIIAENQFKYWEKVKQEINKL